MEMRAAAVRGPGRIEVARTAVPEPHAAEVRIRVQACGICGSDLQLLRDGLFPPERTPGHEFAGVVDALGAGVRDAAPGDAVAVEPFRSCGRCAWCRAGRDPLCREARLLGVHEGGGLAEYVIAPASRLFALPARLDPALAALAEPMAVVVHGLRRGGFEPGQRVLVLGAGSLGLLGVAAARASGAREVWISARHAHQAELARRLGAARVLSEAEAKPDALAALALEVDFDLVVESVGGRADTLAAAAAAVRPGGAVGVLGLFLGPVQLETLPLLMKEVTLAWSYCYARDAERADFARAVELIDAERERLAALVTHRVALDDVARAFAIAADRRAGAVKVSVTP